MSKESVYDYVVIGGGTSGAVIARRLADGDPFSKVCLVEAGPSHENVLDSHMAFAWKNLQGSEYDWGYESTPQTHINGQVLALPRGKILGGSNAINGTLIVRGPKSDYNRIAGMGNPGWAWDDLMPYFKASETFHPSPWHKADISVHGDAGPIHTEPYAFSKISDKVLQSFIDRGFTYKPDMFVQGESEGVGHATRVVYNGVRTTAADFVFPMRPTNLHVRVNTTVEKVILESTTDGLYKAVGIFARDQGSDSTFQITAEKEVIISAGTYGSPIILMHSGIGPKDHLNEVGIDTVVDLPGVGENLIDHVMVTQAYSVPQGLTLDHLVYPEGAQEKQIKEWADTRQSIMSHVPFGPLALARVDRYIDDPRWKERLIESQEEDLIGQLKNQPHVEFFSTDYYGTLPQVANFPKEGQSAFVFATMLCGTKSRGTVKLKSSNASDPPIIDCNIFGSEIDLTVLAAGCRLGHEIITQGKGTKDIVGPWPAERLYPSTHDQWNDLVIDGAGITFHPAGTVKMAPKEDPMRCVNSRLQVYGVKQLRVADCSILPYLPNGHSMAPALVIGEKAAAMILEDRQATPKDI